jgi:hypothetical protein
MPLRTVAEKCASESKSGVELQRKTERDIEIADWPRPTERTKEHSHPQLQPLFRCSM